MLKNEIIAAHKFLSGMYIDDYFPNHAVDMVKDALLRLCKEIESKNPTTPESLQELTSSTVEEIDDLQEVFWDNESEIETGARESILEDFEVIVKAYGFEPSSDFTANRDW